LASPEGTYNTDNNSGVNNNNNEKEGCLSAYLGNPKLINNNNNGSFNDVLTPNQLEPKQSDQTLSHVYTYTTPKVVHSVQEELGKYVSWDLEWNGRDEITACAFYDNDNNSCVYLPNVPF
jgi:hypothetical protein